MVSPARRAQPSRDVGVAISGSGLCAVYGGTREPAMVRVPLEPAPSDSATWPSLARALTELKTTTGGERLSISLMPPLAEVRAVDLPPVRDDEAERVLTRAAGRYFVTARQPQVIGIAQRERSSRTAARPVVAAAAPARLVASIRAAGREAGWLVGSIAPAESAWATAATSLWPAFNNAASFVVIAHRDRVDLLKLERGRLASVRRFRPIADDADAIAAAVRIAPGQAATNIAVLGARDERAETIRALVARGIDSIAPDSRGGRAPDPEILAAEFAVGVTGPAFRTEEARAAWTAGAWRATAVVAAAAVAIVVGGAALKLWGVHRQLTLVRAQRAQLASRLSATLIGRTSVEAVTRNVSGLNAVERTAPTWAQTIVRLTTAIPDGAYLTAFRTRGDSIVVEGLADQASDVFNAMEQLPQLANVRAGAPVRRELQDDTTPLERFTIIAIQPAPSGPAAGAPAR